MNHNLFVVRARWHEFIFAVLLLALPHSRAVAEDLYNRLAETDEAVWQARSHSFAKSISNEGYTFATISGRILHKATKKITLTTWIVSHRDCVNQRGKLIIDTINGEYITSADFIYGGGTIASEVSELICNLYFQAYPEAKKH